MAQLLKSQSAGGTFVFSVGPDRSGRHIGRLFQRGMPGRLWRTWGIRNYGIFTFLYGSILPAPDVGSRCADVMRAVRDSGFETGVRAFDQLAWQRHIADRSQAWITRQMELARSRYGNIFGETPHVHAAAGWQMNRFAYRLSQRLGFAFGSDTRGTHPFMPVYQAEPFACPQLPTTLPTMDELIGRNGITRNSIVEHILELTADASPWGHVFCANAAFEGLKLYPQFEQLLIGWRQQGYEVISLQDYMLSFDTREFPRHEVVIGTIAGRPGTVALQGKEFLS